MIRVVITGVCGRMGRCITRCIAQQTDMELVGAIQYPSHPHVGSDAGVVAGIGAIGVPIAGELDDVLQNADVVIEFSKPKPALAYLQQVVNTDKGYSYWDDWI